MKKIKGAYALVVSSPRKLIGARDPYGFRPLCIGKRGNAYILASESCALDTIGAEFVRDVEPGETVTIKKITGKDEVRLHLAELGFVVDSEVTVVNEIAGNLIVQVKESRLALDRTMANRIMIG